MRRTVLLFVACVLLVGCLEGTPEPAGGMVGVNSLIGARSAVVEIVDSPQLVPVPDPAFTEPAAPAVEFPAAEPAGFTGVRIYGDPDSCNPCRFLLADLRFLRDCHGWTLTESLDESADWQFLPARESDRRVPLIEVWENGRLVGSETGYACSDDPCEREPALLELVRLHPRGRKGGG